MITSGPVGLVTTYRDYGTRDDSELWRTTDKGRSYQRVTLPVPTNMQVLTVPQSLTATKDGLDVVGTSRGLPVLWSVDADRVISKPRKLSSDSRMSGGGIVSGGGSTMIIGSKALGNPVEAVVWSSRDGKTYRRTEANTFQTKSAYASSEIFGARWIKGRWYVVGERSDSGSGTPSALVASSSDRLQWTLGKAATKPTKVDDTPIDDLRGIERRARSIRDLAAVPRGILEVGAASPGDGEEPVVWRSTNGKRWRLEFLPTKGYATGKMSGVEARGKTVVASGTVAKTHRSSSLPYVWRSHDGGKTWNGAVVGKAAEEPQSLSLVGSAFVRTSDDKESGRPIVQKSTDGKKWSTIDLARDFEPDSDNSVLDAAADGKDLVILLRTVTREGSGTELVRIPVG